MVECRATLDRADNKDNADNARLYITFSYDNDECQTFEELKAQKNSHLVEFRTGQRRRTAVYCARGNSNVRTTSELHHKISADCE